MASRGYIIKRSRFNGSGSGTVFRIRLTASGFKSSMEGTSSAAAVLPNSLSGVRCTRLRTNPRQSITRQGDVSREGSNVPVIRPITTAQNMSKNNYIVIEVNVEAVVRWK